MRWTLRHYYPFGPSHRGISDNRLSAEVWDRIRTSEDESVRDHAFHLPASRMEWLRLCESSPVHGRQAADIAHVIEQGRHRAVLSVGAGRACVEFHVKRLLPHVRLTCTEYSPVVVARLRDVFTECDDVAPLDMTEGRWPAQTAESLVLLNRVDTELDDAQWRATFGHLARAGARQVLLVATGFLTPKTIAQEARVRLSSVVRGRALTFAGYARTKSRFLELWQPHYRIATECAVGELTGFLLERQT